MGAQSRGCLLDEIQGAALRTMADAVDKAATPRPRSARPSCRRNPFRQSQTKAAARAERTAATQRDVGGSALRRRGRRRRRRTRTTLGHELVELGLVTERNAVGRGTPGTRAAPPRGAAKSRCGIVKGVIAARWWLPPPLRCLFHALTAPCQRPNLLVSNSPCVHTSAPYEKGQGRETQRPPEDEGTIMSAIHAAMPNHRALP